MYPNVSLFIDGAWTQAAAGRTLPIVSPASGDSIGTVAHAERADLDRALEAADKGFRIWRKVSAFDRSKVMRKAADLLRDRADAIAPLLTHGAGQAAARGQGRSAGRRGRDRLVRRGGAPHLWPRYSRAGRGRLSARGEGAGGPGRGLHAVELPDQPGGAQAVLRAGRRLLDHREGAGGDTGLTCRTDPLLRRCRRARGCDQPGLRRAVGDFRIPHPASDHSQDVVHRLHRGRQAACGDRGRCT